MGRVRLREMVAHGGSTVLDILCYFQLPAVKKEYLPTTVT